MQRSFLALALAGATVAASAQLVSQDPDWKELEAPPPPALRTSGLIPLDVPSSSLRFGIDPASVAIGQDNIVRYVLVATSSSGGAINASYEGIHCHDGKVRVFARSSGSGWNQTPNSEWQPLDTVGATRYSMIVAQSGVCRNAAPNRPVAQILQDLRAPADRRFQAGGANR
jgi:hypothetical protein